MALIGGGGAAEAITQHPVPRRQCRPDHLLHVLGAVGRIEQQLGGAERGRPLGRMEEQLAQGLAQGRAAGLAGEHHLAAGGKQAAAGEPGHQPLQLGGLAAAIDALQHHKAADLAISLRHGAAAGR